MYLREFTQEGIVDAAVQFHRELNPKLWNGKVLKPLGWKAPNLKPFVGKTPTKTVSRTDWIEP